MKNNSQTSTKSPRPPVVETYEHDECPKCGTESVPAERVADQSLRGCPNCEHTWFEDLNRDPHKSPQHRRPRLNQAARDVAAANIKDPTVKPLPVILRRFREGGQLIAFFPTIPSDTSNWYNCLSYMHDGQHAGADYSALTRPVKGPRDTPTTPEPATTPAAAALLAELKTIGYDNLKIYRKETAQHRAARQAEWGRMTTPG